MHADNHPHLNPTKSIRTSTLQASAQDYLSRIASRAGVPLEQLLLDNLEATKDLDQSLQGKAFLVCGGSKVKLAPADATTTTSVAAASPKSSPTTAVVIASPKPSPTATVTIASPKPSPPPTLAKGPPVVSYPPLLMSPAPTPVAPPVKSPAAAVAPPRSPTPLVTPSKPPPQPQLRALLDFKAAIDPKGLIASWAAEAGANLGFCDSFEGVECNEDHYVVNITNSARTGGAYYFRHLGGSLPSGTVLQGLPSLKMITLFNCDLTGKLLIGIVAFARMRMGCSASFCMICGRAFQSACVHSAAHLFV